MGQEMTQDEIKSAVAVVSHAMERMTEPMSEDAAEDLYGELMKVYEPGMTADALLAFYFS